MEDYLHKYCPQNYNWILYSKFDEIKNDISVGSEYLSPISLEDINHVYFFYINSVKNIKITLLSIKSKNINENNENENLLLIDDNVCYKLKDFTEVVKKLSCNKLKYLSIEKNKYLSSNISNISKELSNSIKNRWDNSNIKVENNVLNLTYHYNVEYNDILNINTDDVHTLIINCNYKLTDLNFLKNYKNLKSLNIWNMPFLNNENFKDINKFARKLEIINIHNCVNFNIRILLYIYNLIYIKKILIDDPNFYCQYDIDKQFISNDEWRLSLSESVNHIVINSVNMNLDIIDYIFKSTPNLQSITICKDIYSLCMKNLLVGNHNRTDNPNIIFYTWDDMISNNPVGTSLVWRPTFKNMIKTSGIRNR